MATKIKGRARSLMGSHEFIEGPGIPPIGNPWKQATLVVHDPGDTRIWTHKEVLDLLDRCSEYLEESMEGRLILRFDHLICPSREIGVSNKESKS